MQKTIVYSKDARTKILSGAKKTTDAVKVTLGPAGKCVLIAEGEIAGYGMQYYPVHVSKDGYTVSRCVKLSDPLENVGAMIIREAAQKTVDQAGDGTTATCILAEAIMRGGMMLIENGAKSQELKRGIEKGVAMIVTLLKNIAIPIGDGVEDIRKIAYVSANGDDEIADYIANAFNEIGKEGMIDIQEAKGTKTSISIVDGFKMDKGWESTNSFFINNPAKMQWEMNDVSILLYERPITEAKQIVPILSQTKGKPILVISESISGEALAFLTVNNQQGNLRCCAVAAPGFTQAKKETMEDLAVLTGATFISDIRGIALEEALPQHLGFAKKVVVSKDNTTIIGGSKDSEYFQELLNSLKMNMAEADGEAEKQKIETRISRLMGSVAIIHVGGITETEMKERKDRCDDAVRATKSAIAEGYVPGGGVVFLKLHRQYFTSRITDIPMETSDHEKGVDLAHSILDEPFRQICFNAALSEDEVNALQAEIKVGETECDGYNAKKGKVENMLDNGIIDPVKVLRCALENAASVAGMALITETIICDTI